MASSSATSVSFQGFCSYLFSLSFNSPLLRGLFLGLWHDFAVHCVFCKFASGYQLPELDEIYRVFARHFSCVERGESSKGFVVHVCCQPVTVIILSCIPEELL